MAVTIDQIAAQLGVHKSTVSRALNGKMRGSYISEKRRREIRQCAEELGFRPNSAARTIRSGRTQQIGVMLATGRHGRSPAHAAAADMLVGLSRVIAEAGYLMSLRPLTADESSDQMLETREFQEHLFDGVVVLNVADSVHCARIHEAYPDAVWVNSERYLTKNCIRPDEAGNVRRMVEQIAAQGYRKLVMVAPERRPTAEHYSYDERREAMQAAAEEHGIAWRYCMLPRQELVLHALPPFERGEAVVAHDSYLAMRLLRAAVRDGVRLGTDIGLACCDSIPLLSSVWPDLSRMKLEHFEMGVLAGKMVLSEIGGESCASELTPATWTGTATLPAIA